MKLIACTIHQKGATKLDPPIKGFFIKLREASTGVSAIVLTEEGELREVGLSHITIDVSSPNLEKFPYHDKPF